jgi:hypothetical protein
MASLAAETAGGRGALSPAADWCKGQHSRLARGEEVSGFDPAMYPHGLFTAHLENTRALDSAFDLTARQCREAIARKDVEAIAAFTKTCAFLFGARMETASSDCCTSRTDLPMIKGLGL